MSTLHLHKMTEADARRYIAAQHDEYFAKLQAFRYSLGYTRKVENPTIQVVDSVFSHCGQYNVTQNIIQYSLPYAVYCGEPEYSETIAHELCHTFACSMFKSKPPHGSDFFWLLRDVCGFKNAKQYHPYNVREVASVAYELRVARGEPDADSSFGVTRGLGSALNELNKRSQHK